MFLHAIHDHPVLFPLILSQGNYTADQYASGVMAAHCVIADVLLARRFDEKLRFFAARLSNSPPR